MKKIILVAMFAVCYLNLMNAQVLFGIKGGFNYDNFLLKDSKNELSISNSSGWQAGILLQVKIPEIGAGVQPELIYKVVNADVKDESNSIHYFQVPVNLFKSFNLGVIRPFLEAGPYFGYAVQLDGETFKHKINKFDWGIGLGAGVELSKLQLGARYSWGLQDVSKEEFELKNNIFSLSLAILF